MSIEEVMSVVMDYQAGISTFEELQEAIQDYGFKQYENGAADEREYYID